MITNPIHTNRQRLFQRGFRKAFGTFFKSPLVPLFLRGKQLSSPFRKREIERDFPLLMGISSLIRLTGIAVAVAGFLFLACSPSPTKPPAALFDLTNQRGETVSLDQLKGKTVALTFLYTYCPDVCPLYIGKLYQASEQTQSVQDKVEVLVITVDPERDNVETLKTYTGSWPPNWHYLTGEMQVLKTVWENYGIFVQKQEAKTSGHDGHMTYAVNHTTKIVLIDADGNTVTELKGNWEASELAEKLDAVVAGRPVSGPSFGQAAISFLYNCGSIAFDTLSQAVTHAVTLAAILGALAVVAIVLWR